MSLALVATLVLVLGPRPSAQDAATPRDFQRLQDDLGNLDELLQGLEPNDPTADRFRARAKDLEKDLLRLKTKMEGRAASDDPGADAVTKVEVDRASQDAAQLREDIERAFGASGAAALVLPAGTEFTVRLGRPL